MDIAYDHLSSPIHTDSTTTIPNPSSSSDPADPTAQPSPVANTLPTEFQQAFQAVSSSPWGAKLGGWFNTAKKQGETLIQEAEKEASKGWTSLTEQVNNRTRGMSLEGPVPGEETLPVDSAKTVSGEGKEVGEKGEDGEQRPESLPADIVKEASSVFANLRVSAAAKLRDLAKAEDAADEALEKFGLGVRDFLRNAVVISSPDDTTSGAEVLFSTEEVGTGKKVFHTTRLDAQLHAIHTTATSFLEEPQGEEWEVWKKEFDVEEKTEAVAGDLERYGELRGMMERLVPEKVDYKEFWTRYYWLRKAVEEDERRRKEVLKGAATVPEEEISWSDDEEEDDGSTPQRNATPNINAGESTNHKASQSTTTLHAPTISSSKLEAPTRKSHEDESRSVADSEASYDIVSGATSRATGSPKTKEGKVEGKEESDDDDDWE